MQYYIYIFFNNCDNSGYRNYIVLRTCDDKKSLEYFSFMNGESSLNLWTKWSFSLSEINILKLLLRTISTNYCRKAEKLCFIAIPLLIGCSTQHVKVMQREWLHIEFLFDRSIEWESRYNGLSLHETSTAYVL